MGKHFKEKSKNLKSNIITILMLILFSILLGISSIEIIKWYKKIRENKNIKE